MALKVPALVIVPEAAKDVDARVRVNPELTCRLAPVPTVRFFIVKLSSRTWVATPV